MTHHFSALARTALPHWIREAQAQRERADRTEGERDAARAEAARLRGVVEAAKRWERARTAWDEARERWGETGAEPEYRALDAAGDGIAESADALSAAVQALGDGAENVNLTRTNEE